MGPLCRQKAGLNDLSFLSWLYPVFLGNWSHWLVSYHHLWLHKFTSTQAIVIPSCYLFVCLFFILLFDYSLKTQRGELKQIILTHLKVLDITYFGQFRPFPGNSQPLKVLRLITTWSGALADHIQTWRRARLTQKLKLSAYVENEPKTTPAFVTAAQPASCSALLPRYNTQNNKICPLDNCWEIVWMVFVCLFWEKNYVERRNPRPLIIEMKNWQLWRKHISNSLFRLLNSRVLART